MSTTRAKRLSLQAKSAQHPRPVAQLEEDVVSGVPKTPPSERSLSAKMPVTPPSTDSAGLPTPSSTPLGIAQDTEGRTLRHGQLTRTSGVSSAFLTRRHETSAHRVRTARSPSSRVPEASSSSAARPSEANESLPSLALRPFKTDGAWTHLGRQPTEGGEASRTSPSRPAPEVGTDSLPLPRRVCDVEPRTSRRVPEVDSASPPLSVACASEVDASPRADTWWLISCGHLARLQVRVSCPSKLGFTVLELNSCLGSVQLTSSAAQISVYRFRRPNDAHDCHYCVPFVRCAFTTDRGDTCSASDMGAGKVPEAVSVIR